MLNTKILLNDEWKYLIELEEPVLPSELKFVREWSSHQKRQYSTPLVFIHCTVFLFRGLTLYFIRKIMEKRRTENLWSALADLDNRLSKGYVDANVTASELYKTNSKIRAAYASPTFFCCTYLPVQNRLFLRSSKSEQRQRKKVIQKYVYHLSFMLECFVGFNWTTRLCRRLWSITFTCGFWCNRAYVGRT